MLDPETVQEFFKSDVLSKTYNTGDYDKAPAALSDDSLLFLTDMCSKLGVHYVFEFGSGRSTKALLQLGCSVTSLEDNNFWMNQTIFTLTDNEKKNHTPIVKPLTTRLLNSFLVRDWVIDDKLSQKLKEAQLILVDSPYYTPFRESTLWSSLLDSNGAIIILDDTRIPTLSKFCDRIAHANKSLLHKRVCVGHTIDLFYRTTSESLKFNQSVVDFIKGWRRYFIGVKFYASLDKHQ